MKTYKVLAHITVGAYAHVVANSLEQAQDKAENLEFSDYTILPSSVTEIEQFEIEFGGTRE
jgi:hypothetical protein